MVKAVCLVCCLHTYPRTWKVAIRGAHLFDSMIPTTSDKQHSGLFIRREYLC